MTYSYKTTKKVFLVGILLSFGLFIPFKGQAQTACHDNPTNACLKIKTLTQNARLDYCDQKNFAELIANPLLRKEKQNFNEFITKVHQEDVLDADFLGKELICEARKSHSCLQDICQFIATECRKQKENANNGSGYEQVAADFDSQIERCQEIAGELNELNKVQIETVLTQNTDRKIRTIQNEADSQGRTQAKQELHHRLADVIRQTNRFASKVTVFVEDPLTEDDIADYGEKNDQAKQNEALAYQQFTQKRILAQADLPKPSNRVPTRTIWQRLTAATVAPSLTDNSLSSTNSPVIPTAIPRAEPVPRATVVQEPGANFGGSTPSTAASSSTGNAAGSGLGSIMEIPFNAVSKITESLQIDRLLQNAASIYIGQKLLAGKGPLQQALGSAGINFGLGVLTGSQSLTCTAGSAGCMGGLNTGALTGIGANAAQQYIASEIGADNPLTAALVGQGLNGIFSGASAGLANMSMENLSVKGIFGGIASLPGKALNGILGTAGGAVSDTGRLVEAVGNTGKGLLGGVTGAFNMDQTLQDHPEYRTSGGLFGPMLQGFKDGSKGASSSLGNQTIEQQAQNVEIKQQESLLVQNEQELLNNLKAASIAPNLDSNEISSTNQNGSGGIIGGISGAFNTDQILQNNPTLATSGGLFGVLGAGFRDGFGGSNNTPTTAAQQATTNAAQQFTNSGTGPVDSSFLSGLRLDGIANALNGSFITNVGGAYLAQRLGDGNPIKTVIAQALIKNVMGSVLSSISGATGQTGAAGAAGAAGSTPGNPFGDKPGVVFNELNQMSEACKNPQSGETVSGCRRTDQKEGYFYINGKPFKVVSGGVYQPHMPSGEYKFSPINDGEIFQTTTKKSMSVDSDGDGNRYGFRIGISGKDRQGNWMENGSVWDPTLGRNRHLIRIHSDGPNWFEQDSWLVAKEGYTVNGIEDANLGNAGCLSPIGDEEIQKQFYTELQKAYNKGYKTFQVTDCSTSGSSPAGSPDANKPGAALIVNDEAQRDSNGNIKLYTLPSGDGGGTHEYAGINSKYHPGALGTLTEMYNSGQYNQAESYATNYIADYTAKNMPSSYPFAGNPGVDYFVQDTTFNRGGGGANTIVNMARNMGASSEQQYIQNLKTARESYERNNVGRDESSKFWNGLKNRWDNVTNRALEKSNESGGTSTGSQQGNQQAAGAGCNIDPAATQSSKAETASGSGSSGSGGTSGYGSYSTAKTSLQSTLSHSQVERKLSSGGITSSSSGGCSDPTKSNCTSLQGINESLADALIEVRKQCNCDVVITGGTETGHSSGGMHGTGKAVDIRISQGITNWVEQNQAGTCSLYGGDSACYVIKTSKGNLDFHAETKVSNKHWHVEMPNASSGGSIPRAIPVAEPVTDGAPRAIPVSTIESSKIMAFLSHPLRALKNFIIPTASAQSSQANQAIQQKKGLFNQIHASNMQILKKTESTALDKEMALRRIKDAANSFNSAYNDVPLANLSTTDESLWADMNTKLGETRALQSDPNWMKAAPAGVGGFFQAIGAAIQGIFEAFGSIFKGFGPDGGSALNRTESVVGGATRLGSNIPVYGTAIGCVGAACERGLNNLKNDRNIGDGLLETGAEYLIGEEGYKFIRGQ